MRQDGEDSMCPEPIVVHALRAAHVIRLAFSRASRSLKFHPCHLRDDMTAPLPEINRAGPPRAPKCFIGSLLGRLPRVL